MTWISKYRYLLVNRYRSLDKGILSSAILLMLFGIVLTFAASPGSAERANIVDSYHFVKRQLLFLGPTFFLMLGVAFFPLRTLRLTALFILLLALICMGLVFIIGTPIKGSYRWINIGFTLQPSELMKPCFAVIAAWFMAKGRLQNHSWGYRNAFALFALVSVLLFFQPDIGMLLTTGAIFGGELFLSGLSYWIIGILLGGFALAGVGIYLTVPHVHLRIDRFLGADSEVSYQVEKSLQALSGARWFGKGPGEGVVKFQLPDAHTDFILAVSAEEFGFVITAVLMGTFMFIMLRGLYLVYKENNLFAQIAVGGLLIQIVFQAIVNMGATVNVLPTKGMTLPFISYGGSSLISMGLVFGFILALTRRHTTGRGLE